MIENWVGIYNDDYSSLTPVRKLHNALTVFNLQDAKLAFHHAGFLDFVIALNESTGTFGICHNVMECERFYNPEKPPNDGSICVCNYYPGECDYCHNVLMNESI